MDTLRDSELSFKELYEIQANLEINTRDVRFLAIKDGESYWQVEGRGFVTVDRARTETELSEGHYTFMVDESIKKENLHIRKKLQRLYMVELLLSHDLDFVKKQVCMYDNTKVLRDIAEGIWLMKEGGLNYDALQFKMKVVDLDQTMRIELLEYIKLDKMYEVVELSNVICLFKQAYLEITEGGENEYHGYINIYDRF
ncbi:hypothetical protein [Bacillus toyonensis]|uniref:hypothetical protein n=1 Tax=Bacillus toyonensis TaxID=155322 RepID=UPI000BF3069A|nr:hypothetical protein [Bacillus toyonensis]PGF05048.1 hypothetical protein COM61_01020 [Bacillus toyonensis]